MASNYYLGVKTVLEAARALGQLPFVKVLDIPTLTTQIMDDDRIVLRCGPASSDNDLSKGVMIWITGRFTPDETVALDRLSGLADPAVTKMVATFVTKQAVDMQRQGIGATHKILGQASSERQWWKFWK